MTKKPVAILACLAALLVTLVAVRPAAADDSEIFFSSGGSGSGPNIVFVIDTSGSMSTDAPIVASSYSSLNLYRGNCVAGDYYFVTGALPNSNPCPSSGSSSIPYTSNLYCTSAQASLSSIGSYAGDTFAYYRKYSNYSKWYGGAPKDGVTDTTCKADNKLSSGTSKGFPNGANGATTEWTSTTTNSWWAVGGNKGTSYTVYTGNYLNYKYNTSSSNKQTKLQVVQNTFSALIPTFPAEWNVALMTYNYASNPPSGATGTSPQPATASTPYPACGSAAGYGGSSGYGACVLVPFATLGAVGSASRTALVNAVNNLTTHGDTPLVASMYEAYRYLEGLGVYFGNDTKIVSGTTCSSSNTTSTTGTYTSQPQSSCQKNYVIFLTDGLPNENPSYADTLIASGLYNSTTSNICKDTPPSGTTCQSQGGSPINGGTCLSGLTSYMNGTPNVTVKGAPTISYPIQTYFLAFGVDPCLLLGFNYIANAAAKGGGQAFQVQDGDSLLNALNTITTQVVNVTTSFLAPTVAVNAFNRTQTLNDVYISMFKPELDYHWPGNLKHYTLSTSGSTAGQFIDSAGNLAVSNGFIASSAVSAFSGQPTTTSNAQSLPEADGTDITLGGAAVLLPCWQDRYVFIIPSGVTPASGTTLGTVPASQVAGTAVTSPVNCPASATPSSSAPGGSTGNQYLLSTGNSKLTAAALGVPTTDTTTTAQNVIDFALGADLNNSQGTNSTGSGGNTLYGSRLAMGDALHGQPGIVIYGGYNGDGSVNASSTNAYIYATDNDGFLHAINAYTGQEAWAFVPTEFVDNLYQLYQNAFFGGPPKNYTLDGSVQVLKYDVNGNGVVDASQGDRVIIYFSDGRGGSNYYALDVTNPLAPQYLWTLTPTQLPGVGQTWSTPVIAKVNTGLSAQTSVQKLVLIFGGGYDPSEDSTWNTQDTVGNAIYMVDAKSGSLLWQGMLSGASTTAPSSTSFAAMTHAFPGSITVLDTNGDGYADRLYAGDLGGQVWRFDITNAGSSTSFAVAGGPIASLGAKVQADDADQRRFYNAPDVALVQQPGVAPYFDIAIGSGYRGHPLQVGVRDRMYALRDFSPLTPLTQTQYNNLTLMIDATATASSGQASLTDITTAVNSSATPSIPATSVGWQYDLNSATGEKSLSSPATVNNEVIFTTYTPAAASSSSSCTAPQIGTNYYYALSVSTGTTGLPGGKTNIQLQQTGIAPSAAFFFPPPPATNATGTIGSVSTSTSSTPAQVNLVCTAGVEVLGVCKTFNTVIKTYWTESDSK